MVQHARCRRTSEVYVVDITAAQRSLLAKLAKETSLLSYGYDPERLGGVRAEEVPKRRHRPLFGAKVGLT